MSRAQAVEERRKHRAHGTTAEEQIAGMCATAHLEMMVYGDCYAVHEEEQITCDECIGSAVTR